MASPGTIKPNYENASPVAATSPPLFGKKIEAYATFETVQWRPPEGEAAFMGRRSRAASLAALCVQSPGRRAATFIRALRRAERRLSLANKGFTDTPQGHVSCMKWRGLVARLRNGFNMQEDEEGEDEEGKKKKMFHSGCQGQIQVFAAEAVFPGTESLQPSVWRL